MMPEKIAAWFVPRSAGLGGGGGGGGLKWTDIAAACAGRRSRLGYHLIQARYLNSSASEIAAVDMADAWLVAEIASRSRHMTRVRRRQVAAIGVIAFCRRTHCVKCDGTGEIPKRIPKAICPTCSGRGVREMRNAEKARLMGIRQQSWDSYIAVFDALMAHLDAAEQETSRIVTAKLKSGDWQ